METFALDRVNLGPHIAECRTVAGQFCDDDQRLAFRLQNGECGYEYLLFVARESGTIVEQLGEPADWLAKQPWIGKPADWIPSEAQLADISEPYRGEILVCDDGKRLFQRTVDRCGWQWRQRTPKGWRDGPAVPVELRENGTILEASADGRTVVLAAKIRHGRHVTAHTILTEVWSVGPRGKVTRRGPIPPIKAEDYLDPEIAVSSGRRPLIAICDDGWGTVRDLNGDEVVRLKVPSVPRDSRNEPKCPIRFSNDGRRLVGLFGSTVITWDRADWSASKIAVPGTAPVLVAISPKGETIAVASRDGVVRFFDAASGAPGTVIAPPLTQKSNAYFDDKTPTALCFSSDGTMCLLASADGAIAIWDLD